MKNRRKQMPDHNGHSRSGYCVCCLMMCISLLLTACGRGSTADNNVSNTASGVNNIPDDSSSVGAGNIPDDGNDADTASADNAVQEPEYVYVPELITVEDEQVDYGRMQQVGDSVCYISMNRESENEGQNICRYSLTDKELSRTPIAWPVEEKNRDVGAYVFTSDHNVWLTANVYSADYSRMSRFLCKFDSEGKNLFSGEITDQIDRDAAIGSMAMDRQGRIYVFTGEYADTACIWLYTADGDYHGSVSYGSLENVRVRGTADGEDGRFYVCVSAGVNPERCILMEMDFENEQLSQLTGDFPDVKGFSADPAGQYDFLLYDDISAYGYDLSAQKSNSDQAAEELLVWGDCEVNGYYVRKTGVLEDGRYFCTVEDWEHDDRGIVLLNRIRSEEAPKRENIVLASVGGGGDPAALAVRFSRGSDKYRLTVKYYDSLTDLYNALLAKETIDIIDLSGVNVEKLSGQGVFADLTPYLEQSEAVGPSDFLEGILEAYTFDGILVGIPEAFTLRTVVGDGLPPGGTLNGSTDGLSPGGTLNGSTDSLSLDGMLAAAGSRPGALPFDMTKEEMMQYIMMFNEETFINWDTGECHFDSEQFKEVLEFCGRFPDGDTSDRRSGYGSGKTASESYGNGQEVSLPAKIQNGEVLFAIADMRDLNDFQLYEGIFGENAVCMGFPTPDGKGGTLLFPGNVYGIAASSENQGGAWEFIEDVLTQVNVDGMEAEEVYDEYCLPGRFPALKKVLNTMAEYRMESDAQRRSDRFPLVIYEEDGWHFQYHAVTQDDINVILDLLEDAVPAFSVENDDILNIINEEAAACYSGQKEIDDVADIIQNRIQLYVSENRLL